MRRWVFLLLGTIVVLAGCTPIPDRDLASPGAIGDASTDSPEEWSGVTREVPADYPNIQAAVDAASPGDLVLVDRGVYKETVTVSTPGITIRGVDRNEVIIDGEFERPNGIEVLFTDGVVVENMTSMNNTINGFYWTGARGYRGSYLTAVNNGDYGIYAFDSGDGLFEHSYGSGSPDAAFYIGQCDPCDAVVTDSVGEWNGMGFSGSNASGPIYIVNNVFRFNGSGIIPNSLDSELLPPTTGPTVVGNLVYDNGYSVVPYKSASYIIQGTGILLAGANDSLVARNRVFNHPLGGIQTHFYPDGNVWIPEGNTVVDNVVEGSGLANLVQSGPSYPDNCWEGNEPGYTMPPVLEIKQPCDGLRLAAGFEMGSVSQFFGRIVEWGLDLDPDVFYGDMPHPGPQPQLPGGAAAPVVPAVNVFQTAEPDIDAIEVPPMPANAQVTQQKGFNLMGVTFGSAIGGLLGLYSYVLPLVLYAAWVVLAIWDIVKRDDLSRGAGMGWMIAVLLIPFLGAIGYHVFGGSSVPVAYRWVLLLGGPLIYVLFIGIGLAVAGVL